MAGVAAHVVIGANYGDEGKGLITDALVSRIGLEHEDASGGDDGGCAVVVRANSSAQAGHTVVTPDGRRHVFHHVGAGAFAGAATVLSRFFVAHPLLLGEELARLRALGVEPELFVDPRARVAVPHDVLINQAVERARGGGRHGSCGIGFGEAVERSLRPRFAVTVADLSRPDVVLERLRSIASSWLPRRLEALGLAAEVFTEAELAVLDDDSLLEAWLADVEAFRLATTLLQPGTLPPGPVVFENAQGLLLDAESADFPHVTRSRTGLTNVVRLAQETDIDHLKVIYTTRAYLTRHGAGPLPRELSVVPDGLVDPTNQVNDFQGALRHAWLDLDELAHRISDDLAVRADGITFEAGIAVTCLDQLDPVTYRVGGMIRTAGHDRFLGDVARLTGLPVVATSRGPSRAQVVLRAS